MYVIYANTPPLIPQIFGPNYCEPYTESEYAFLLEDPDAVDEFQLWVDWGDGENTGWIGNYYGEETVKLEHWWKESGTYTIKAKCKDYCNESNWGTLDVTVPRTKAVTSNILLLRILERFPLLQQLLDVWRSMVV